MQLTVTGATGLSAALAANAPVGLAADTRLLVRSAADDVGPPELIPLEGTDPATILASMGAGDVVLLITG